MGFRLTVLLAAAIFVVMYFSPAPEPQRAATEPASPPPAAPAPVVPADPPQEARQAVPAAPPASPVQTAARTEVPQTEAGRAGAVVPPEPAASEEDSIEDLAVLGLGALGPSDSREALGLAEQVRLRAARQAAAPPDLTRPVLAETTRLETPAQVPAEQAAALRRAQVLGSSVNLRAGPSTANPVVGRVDFGDEVRVLDDDAAPGWSEIRHPDTGASAFIASRFLQILP